MKTRMCPDMMKKLSTLLLAAALLIGMLPCAMGLSEPDYGNPENWVYAETDREDTAADVFFVCPTAYTGNLPNMPVEDETARASFLYATNMEKGIYDDNARFFAPYYRQMSLWMYEQPEAQWEAYRNEAYGDVKRAFEYYLRNYNDGRPIILAGFSQGADHCIRLMKDFYGEEPCASLIVACYAIGWRFTREEQEAAPYLKFASGETDTGVIVAFNTEAESVESSLILPAGMKTMTINPLNWRTDGTCADRSLNLGACFTTGDGSIVSEIPQMTGAYIDPIRGALKAPDVNPADYPSTVSFLPEGVYHVFDYMFFYRNLEKNVQDRIAAYLNQIRQPLPAAA